MDKQQQHISDRVMIYAVIWCLSYLGSLYTLTSLSVPPAAGIVVTVVTMLAFGVFVYKYYRSLFFMDEVNTKIHLEAVVIAFALGLFLLMTIGLLDLFLVLNKGDWSYRHLIPLFFVFYFLGLFISRRKYNFENEKHH